MPIEKITVKGIDDVVRGFNRIDRSLRTELQAELKRTAEPVKNTAAAKAARYSSRTAAGVRLRARRGSVYVEQSQRKTTGHHPEFGRLQMRRVFIPALVERRDEVIRALEEMLDRLIGSGFGRGGRL